MTAVEIAAEVLSAPVAELTATHIKGGLTNESWCVTGADITVVVRISTADEEALQLNRASEMQVLKLVEQAGIGAPVLLCAPQRRVLVTRFLPGGALTREAASTPRAARQLARLLRQLHALPIPASVQHIDLPVVLQGYWHSLEARGALYLAGTEADRRRALDIAIESAGVPKRCLCHNDVHHLNVIDNGERLWLLDWEYAGAGDPFFDLASVACYHVYDADLRAMLLESYLGTVDRADMERLERMCWLFDYIKNLWLAVRALANHVSPGLSA